MAFAFPLGIEASVRPYCESVDRRATREVGGHVAGPAWTAAGESFTLQRSTLGASLDPITHAGPS